MWKMWHETDCKNTVVYSMSESRREGEGRRGKRRGKGREEKERKGKETDERKKRQRRTYNSWF